MKTAAAIIGFGLMVASSGVHADSHKAAGHLYFISPVEGDQLSGAVTVRFGLTGMGVAPAGADIPGTGHHHLVIDAPLPALDETIPKDEHYRHFGKGQTETTLDLAPGTHTMQLVLGDYAHIPHKPPLVSEKISITVK